MMDREVALEALGALCNAKVTSVQRPGVGLQGAAVSGASAPSLLTIHDLVHRVLHRDAFRSRVSMMKTPGWYLRHAQQIQGRKSGLCPTTKRPEKGAEGIMEGHYKPGDGDAYGRGAYSTPEISEDEWPRTAYSIRISIDTDKERRGKLQLEVDEVEFFDPKFDYDFTNITDHQTFYRGGEVYERPCGWTRFALKVLGQYDDDTWLGNDQRTTDSVPGEWPVSYHGTSMSAAEGIIEGHYKPGDGDAYGRGVYSTPHISVAECYTTEFWSEKMKKQYRVLLQNRINPEYRKKHNDDKYWLVEIPEGTSKQKEKEMVNRAIRPYGLLIKEFKPPNLK